MVAKTLFSSDAGDVAIGFQPSSSATQMGQAQQGAANAAFAESGNLVKQVSSGINPGVINQDNVLAVAVLPAGIFDQAGRGLAILAAGSFANNVNSKRCKIFVNPTAAVVGSQISGGTLIADTGAYTTAAAVGWELSANIFKYGAAGSNTQMAIHESAQAGSTVGQLLAPQALTLNEASPITIAVTGDAVTALTDIALNLFEIFGQN